MLVRVVGVDVLGRLLVRVVGFDVLGRLLMSKRMTDLWVRQATQIKQVQG